MNRVRLRTLLLLAALVVATTPEQLLAKGAQTTAVRGGTLVLATQPILQTDPAFISTDAEVAVANAVYDYLVDVGADNQIKPRLATSWTVSDDGLTYTFTLAPGVRFHDGSAFGPEDVVWTFNRLRNPDVGSGAADLYANLRQVRAQGSDQVVFRLSEANPFFLFDLSDNRALVLKRSAIDGAAFNGTGPFRIASYTPEDRIRLVKNDQYFVTGQPRLDLLEIVFYPDEAARIDALRSGEVDMVWRHPDSVQLSLEQVSGIRTLSVPTNRFDVFRIRTDRGPGSDPRVVRAIKMAVNRQEIYDRVHLGRGGLGNDSPMGPLYTAYHVPASFQRNLTEARNLLQQAGFGAGLAIELQTPDTGARPQMAVLLKEQLAQIGVHVTIRVQPESVYYGSEVWLEADFGITGWGSRPVPQFYFDVMLVCGAKWNEAHFCDQEVDRLAETARTTLDENLRGQAYVELQRIFFERGPLIVAGFWAQNAAVSDRVTGLELKAFAGRTDFSTVGVK